MKWFFLMCGYVPSIMDRWALYISPAPCLKSVYVTQHSSNQQQSKLEKRALALSSWIGTLQKYHWQRGTSDFNTDNSAAKSLGLKVVVSRYKAQLLEGCHHELSNVSNIHHVELSTGVNVSSLSAATSCAVLGCFLLDQGWTNQPSEGPQCSRDSPGILAFLGESVCLHGQTENPAGLLHSLGHHWVRQRKENCK